MGLANSLKKKIKAEEVSIGKELAHLHPHIKKRKDVYRQWVQDNQPRVGIPRIKKQSMISEHTTVNPITGLQGTSDMQAMKRIKKKAVKLRRRPGR